MPAVYFEPQQQKTNIDIYTRNAKKSFVRGVNTAPLLCKSHVFFLSDFT